MTGSIATSETFLIAGLWKFRVPFIELDKVALDWLQKDPKAYEYLQIRHSGDDVYVIEFRVRVPHRHADVKRDYDGYVHKKRHQLKELFGKGLISWDISNHIVPYVTG